MNPKTCRSVAGRMRLMLSALKSGERDSSSRRSIVKMASAVILSFGGFFKESGSAVDPFDLSVARVEHCPL